MEHFPGVGPKVGAVFETFGKSILILLAMGLLKHFMASEGRVKITFNNNFSLTSSLLPPQI